MAAPVALIWPKFMLAGVPPISNDAPLVPALCVKLPLTLSVPAAPMVRLPELMRLPDVLKVAPSWTVKLPTLLLRPDRLLNAAPAPPRTTVASFSLRIPIALSAMDDPPSAFHVPPVRTWPDTWAIRGP